MSRLWWSRNFWILAPDTRRSECAPHRVHRGRRSQAPAEYGLLEKRPYQEPGQRTRHEYVLAERGHDLLPVLMALGEWSRKHSPTKGGTAILHDGCDADVRIALRCANGHHLVEDDLVVTTQP